MTEILIVECPNRRQPVVWTPENKYRPFCSERCKLIDLGEWADEKYAVVAQEEEPMSGWQKGQTAVGSWYGKAV